MIRRSRVGLTLVEVLVVYVAILATLIGLLLPAVQLARESARATQCISQLRQLGIAATSHTSAKGHLPSGVEQWYFNDRCFPPGNSALCISASLYRAKRRIGPLGLRRSDQQFGSRAGLKHGGCVAASRLPVR